MNWMISLDKSAYDQINEHALACIEDIADWLDLEGEQVGKEFKFLNPKRLDAELGSCSVNTETGCWGDFAIDDAKGGDLISLVAYIKDVKQGEAAKMLWEVIESPENIPAQSSRHAVAKAKIKPAIESVLVMPVPEDAPSPPAYFGQLGSPTSTYRYLDAEGRLSFIVLRFDSANGQKEFRPMTLWCNPQGQQQWQTKAPPVLRPLYGLDQLHARPAAPVMVVEGEKAADAAAQLFPDHVVVTTMNGAKSPDKSDLSPLVGREVFIWPDHDEPGQKYAETVTSLLRSQNSTTPVSVMQPLAFNPGMGAEGGLVLEPGFVVPKGWDAADALDAGWTPQHIALLPSVHFKQVSEGALVAVKASQNSLQSNIFSDHLPPAIKNFLLKFFPHGLIYSNETFLGYEGGFWRKLDERPEVARKIAYYFGQDLENAKEIRNLLDLLKNLLAQREIDVAPNKKLICLENGTLDTSTYSLVPHSPAHWLQTKIPTSWVPEAGCERWQQFLGEIFANDLDQQQKITFVQEWFGYCLTPDANQHKFVWMVGAGGNGKSVLLNILTYLVGQKNVSHAYLERLDRGCVRAELEGKLVNISSEMSAEATIADGYFKAIVSGDIVEAERKFKPPFSFRPYVRLIGATNHLPRLLDLSEGFFRRAIILTFNRQFAQNEQDASLESKLFAELPGILVWSMEGLQRLRARERFEVPMSSVAALNTYRQEADPIGLFVEDCLDRAEIGGMRSSEIYEGYSKWCRANGYAPKNISGFGKRLKELRFESYRTAEGSCWKVNAKAENGYIWGEAEVRGAVPAVIEQAPISRYSL